MKNVFLSIMQLVKRRCERKLARNRQEKKKNIKIKQAAPVLFGFFWFFTKEEVFIPQFESPL